MIKFFLAATAALCSVTAAAQSSGRSADFPVKNISVELLGGSNGIGIHYDTRFKGNSGWGYALGAGWGFSQSSNLFNNLERYHTLSAIPRVNYLLGRKNRKLELGIGANLGYLFGKEEYDTYRIVNMSEGEYLIEPDRHVTEHRHMFTYFFFGNIGYRRQAVHGLVFRAGLAPVFGFGGSHTVDKFYLLPYLGFGKSF
jgi:hypothetical protein